MRLRPHPWVLGHSVLGHLVLGHLESERLFLLAGPMFLLLLLLRRRRRRRNPFPFRALFRALDLYLFWAVVAGRQHPV